MCLSKEKNKPAWFKFLCVALPHTELLLNHFLLFILFCWGWTEVSFTLRWRSHCYSLFLNVPLSGIFPRDFSSRRIERRAGFRSNSHREITVSGERSHHSLLLALSSELASGKWDCTNTGLHPCRFPRCQRGKGLPAASSESICLPPLPRKVCSHTLLSAKLEAETVSEQADVTPKSDGSSNTSQGEFPLPGSRRGGIWEEHWRGSWTPGFLSWGPWPPN